MHAAPAPPLIGRGDEFAVLASAFAEGTAGKARAIVVRGEAGVGKTRLLREFVTWAANGEGELPVIVASGQCVEQGEIGAPFTPLRRLLWDLYSAVGDDAFRAAAGTPAIAAALAPLLPELAAPDTAQGPAAALDFLSDAVGRVLERLSQENHVVAIIEDLHWADGATLSLLRNLALTLRGSHLTLVATYRSDDVGRGHPLRAALADFERNRAVATVEVRRLGIADVAALVETITGSRPDRATVEVLAARSEGVPFYVEELVAVGAGQLPETLRDVVLARYERLDDSVQRVARAIAVAGARVDHEILGAAWAGDRRELEDGLRAAVADGLLVTDANGYAFRHALMQEAIYDELLPSERAALHAAFAMVLQQRVDAGELVYASDAAQHWLTARDLERAFLATLAARTHALSPYAPVTAALLGERILELWDQVPRATEFVGLSATALRVQIARNLVDATEYRAAQRVARRGLEVAATDEIVERAQLEETLALCASETEGRAAAVKHFEAAERLVRGATDPVGLAILSRATAAVASMVPSKESEEKVRSAIEFGKSSGDMEVLSYAARRLVDCYFAQGRADAAANAMREHLKSELPPDPSCDRYRVDSTVAFADTLNRVGGYEEAYTHALRMYDVAEQLGMERGVGAALLVNAAESCASLGRPDEAMSLAARALALFPTDLVYWASFAYRVQVAALVWDDRIDDAMALTDSTGQLTAQALANDPEEAAGWTAPLISLELARAQRSRPAVRTRHLAAALEQVGTLDRQDVRERLVFPMMALPWAAMAVAVADADGFDTTQQRAVIAACLEPLPMGGWMAGPRAFIAACEEPSVAAWADSSAWEGLPVSLQCWARLQYGSALAAGADKGGAITTLRSLEADAAGSGVRLVARLARDALSALGAGASQGPLAELTGREFEVLALVAGGLTNGEIGKRLFISTKTASVHVSAILSKLGAANRAEAAALFAALPQAHEAV